MSSRAAFSAPARACGSMSSSSTPIWAVISGPSGSTSLWPISSTCRTRSSRGSRTRCTPSSPPPRRDAPNRRRTPTRWTSIFQGMAWFYKGPTPYHLAQACSCFDRALVADPDNVEALIGSAAAHAVEGSMSLVADPMAAFAAAEAKLTKALSLAPDHPGGHVWLGLVDIWTKRAAEGIAECEYALKLDPNLAPAHYFIGYGKLFVGRAEETESHIGEALRLS